VDEEAVLAYLSDGRRLRNDNIRDLAGAEDQVCILVFGAHVDVSMNAESTTRMNNPESTSQVGNSFDEKL